MSKSLRDKMPWVAELVDRLRKELGQEFVDGQIRCSLRGDPVFFATESGHQVGTQYDLTITSVVYWDERGISQSREPEWIPVARELAQQRGIEIKPADQDDYRDVVREANELRVVMHSRDSADVCKTGEDRT